MKPVAFLHANLLLTGHHIDGVGDLPVFRGSGQIVSCWELSEEEFAEVACTRVVWVHVSAPVTSPPIALQAFNPFPYPAIPADPATESKG